MTRSRFPFSFHNSNNITNLLIEIYNIESVTPSAVILAGCWLIESLPHPIVSNSHSNFHSIAARLYWWWREISNWQWPELQEIVSFRLGLVHHFYHQPFKVGVAARENVFQLESTRSFVASTRILAVDSYFFNESAMPLSDSRFTGVPKWRWRI